VKNKKLFAILTLVCFMFTLMPVAAFAADPGTYDADQVYVGATAAPVPNDDNDGTELTVNVTNPQTGVGFKAYVGNANGSDVTTAGYVFYVIDENGVYTDVNRGGEFSGLKVAGDYTVYAINVAADADNSYRNVDAELAKIASVESKVEAIKTWAGAAKYVNGTATVTVETPEYEYKVVLSLYNKNGEVSDVAPVYETINNQQVQVDGKFVMSIDANNGFSKDGKVIAQVQRAAVDANGNVGAFANFPRAGLELAISEAGYIDVTADTLKTNNKGQVVFEVTSDYAANGNKVIVKYGKAKAELTVNVGGIGVADVLLNAEPTAPMNNEDAIQSAGIEFKFVDADGVAANATERNGQNGDYVITLVEKPAKSNMKASDFALLPDNDGKLGVFDLVGDNDAVNNYTDEFDKDGKYVIKVSLENGAAATATVEVAEMGDVVAIQFVKAPLTVPYGSFTAFKEVVAIDANGVTTKLDLSDPSEVKLSANGVAVAAFAYNAQTGGYKLDAQNDDKYIGQTITVMAKHDDFVATTTVKVVDQAATVKYLSNTAETGVSTELIGMIYDSEGKMSGIGADIANATPEVIVLEKPEGAVAVATATMDRAKAQVKLNFLANTPGEYKVQTVLTYGTNPVKYISGIETITVGGGVNTFKDVVVVSLGADKMIVNNEVVALDVAPFIENNRTMMQFNVLYVFGIDVEWVAETQSIVAEGNGLKVVMQLGSKVATVNGAEVALDVAPYTVNGRTVVPVGFITGLLDITPTFTYNADGTIADILFTK